MPKRREAQATAPTRVIEMRSELARQIAAHIRTAGEQATAVPGLILYRRTTPMLAIPVLTSQAWHLVPQRFDSRGRLSLYLQAMAQCHRGKRVLQTVPLEFY
jgi:hypothetical protein